MIQNILKDKVLGSCIVLSPTRELAQQTHKTFEKFGKDIGITSVSVIGGESMGRQQKLLSDGAHIIVGTPGRINDLARKRHIDLRKVDTVVFDEADRLFDMGFKKDIEYLLNIIPRQRQMIMMSATTNQEVLRTAYKFNSHPEEICLSVDSLVVEKIDHSLVMMSAEEKFPYLVNYLRKNDVESSFIFCNTQVETHLVGEWLNRMGFKAAFISGKLAQTKRTKLIQQFREQKIQHLVCTDVAARGLDINNVELVVNYQLPNEADNYVHRVGRTGRAGKSGMAISLCAFEDCENLESIKETIGEDIPVTHVEDNEFATDICKRPKIDSRSLKFLDKTNNKEKKTMGKTMSEKGKKVKQTAPETAKALPPFLVTAENYDEALGKALGHFNIEDPELLENKVVKKTGKKFLMFGKEEITYEFVKKANVKKAAKKAPKKSGEKKMSAQDSKAPTKTKRAEAESIDLSAVPAKLEPFIQELLKKMGLDLTYDIEVQERRLKVDIRGEDIGLVLTNKKQLMYALETIMRQFLFRKELITKQSHLSVYAHGTNPKPAKVSRYDEVEEDDEDNFGNREHNGEREFRGADYGEVEHKRRPRNRKNANGNSNGNRKNASGNRRNANGNRNGNRNGNFKRGPRDNKPVNHTDEFLQDMARILRDQVLEEGEARMTKSLNPYERRIVHETLHDDQRVKTESEGDGKFKQIKISKISAE